MLKVFVAVAIFILIFTIIAVLSDKENIMITKEHALLVKENIINNWLAEDGLMCLKHIDNESKDPDWSPGDRESYGIGLLRTAENDNGLLFVVEFYMLCETLGILDYEDQLRFLLTMKMLERLPGLYHKNPGRYWRNSTHDDYIGAIAGSVLFNTEHAKDVVDYGRKNMWFYNNVDPGEPRLGRWRQWSDTAFYKIASGIMPFPWEIAWMLGRIVLSPFSSKDNNSGKMLSWLKLKAMEIKYKRELRKKLHFKLLFLLIKPVKWFFVKMIEIRFGNVGELIKAYYTPSWPMPYHPIKNLADQVTF